MRRLALGLAVFAALALTGCAGQHQASQTGGTPAPSAGITQAQVDDAFANACFVLKAADIAFGIAGTVAPNIIDADAQAWESKIMLGVTGICNGPPPNIANYKTVINSVLDYASQIQKVVKAAHDNAPTRTSSAVTDLALAICRQSGHFVHFQIA